LRGENFTLLLCQAAQGSILTNKYAEGLPGKRAITAAVEYIDRIEQLALVARGSCLRRPGATYKPHSGAQANFAVFLNAAGAQTPDGMDLSSWGHLTHG